MEDIKTLREERQIVLEELIDEKESVKEEITDISKQIEELTKNDAVIEYLLLCSEIDDLYDKEHSLCDDIRTQRILNCDHIFVNERINYSQEFSPEKQRYVNIPASSELKCIKCSLNAKRILRPGKEMLTHLVSRNSVIISDYAKTIKLRSFEPLQYPSFDLGSAVYQRILERNPDIDEETAKRYYESAMRNIIGKDMPKAKHIDRAKRLNFTNPNIKYKN